MSESAAHDPLAYAITYGCISLNSAFVVRNKRHRLFRKMTVRLSLPEMIWIVIATLVYAGILALLVLLLGMIPIIQDIVSWLMILPAPIAGWYTGRRIARASPYRRYSGEGLGEYLWVQSEKLGPVLGRIIGGRRVATSEVATRASGRRLEVECVEWIGTARAQLMPKFIQSKGNKSIDIIFEPTAIPTDWVRAYQLQKSVQDRG